MHGCYIQDLQDILYVVITFAVKSRGCIEFKCVIHGVIEYLKRKNRRVDFSERLRLRTMVLTIDTRLYQLRQQSVFAI